MNKNLATLAATTAFCVGLQAQGPETYWVANRASNDIMQLSSWGSVIQRVDMSAVNPSPGQLRSAHIAPDGKVWVIRFIQPTFDIYDPVTQTITSVTNTLGNPYDIAFDNQDTAWVSGGSGVVQYDGNGVLIQSIPLPAGAPLGITIDAMGNKWIAHRTNPGSLSRIDPANVVTNFPTTPASIQPVRPIADYRGLLMPSHIWVTGDPTSGGELVEMDDQGTVLNVYPMPASTIGGAGPAFDLNGNIWVGNYSTGAIYEVDSTNGAVLNTYTVPNNAIGVSVDGLGRVLATARVTFSGVGPPCEIRRINPANGMLEMNTLLQYNSFVASGTYAAVATPFQHSLVVAPLADRDGDGDANWAEIQNQSSPIDPCSNSVVSLSSSGVHSATNGGTAYLDVRVQPGTFWLMGLALGIVPAGTGITLPGVACEILLDPTAFLGSVAGVSNNSIAFVIPADPGLVDVEFHAQVLAVPASGPVRVSNFSGMKLW